MNLFYPVKSSKVSELITQQTKNDILKGIMKLGDRLLLWQELVERFQTNRFSFRETLDRLKTSGLLILRISTGFRKDQTRI